MSEFETKKKSLKRDQGTTARNRTRGSVFLRLLVNAIAFTFVAAGAASANTKPQAVPDGPFTIHNNGSLLIDVLANDSDPDGDSIFLSGPIDDPVHPLADHATVTKEGQKIRYVPFSTFVGTDTFRYRINDGALFHSAIVTVNVTANRQPTARPDSATAVAGQTKVISVLVNDDDPDGDPIFLSGPIDDPNHPLNDHATVVRIGSVLHYTADSSFAGTDTFRYRINDGILFHSNIVTVQVASPLGQLQVRRGDTGAVIGGGQTYPFGSHQTGALVTRSVELHNIAGGPLTITSPPSLGACSRFTISQPLDRTTIPLGEKATFRVRLLTDQVVTNASCNVSFGTDGAPASFSFKVSGSVSSCTLPAITAQPVSRTVIGNAPVSFTVAASGTPAPTYQWFRNGVAIPGATAATYSIAMARMGQHAGTYHAEASNSCGTVASQAASLTVNCSGPGDLFENLADRLEGVPRLCNGTSSYKPTFPLGYVSNLPEYNTPVLAAAFELVDNPGRSGPNGGDVLTWWIEYLESELGLAQNRTWHFGAKEPLSGIYQFYNVNAVTAVHSHATVKSLQVGADGRYATIGGLAKSWLRASIAFMAAAAIEQPATISNGKISHALPGQTTWFVALAGPRYRHIAWERQMRSMIYERAVNLRSSFAGEPSNQRRVLNRAAAQWPASRPYSVFGLSSAEAASLASIASVHALPAGFIGNYLGGIELRIHYEIVGWSDGSRLTFLPAALNNLKAPTFGKLYRAGSSVVETLYPYTVAGDHANPLGGFASFDVASGRLEAHDGRGNPPQVIANLPPAASRTFHLVFDNGCIADLVQGQTCPGLASLSVSQPPASQRSSARMMSAIR